MQPLTAPTPTANAHYTNLIGDKAYELANHLGNVLNVVKDRKLATSTNGTTVAYFQPDVVSYSDYYPFGQALPYRNGNTPEYRYGFNGMEKDDEIKGTGNSYDFGARILDPRIGRWLSVDPLAGKYPDLSPYNYVANMPIIAIDPDGQRIIIKGEVNGKKVKIKYVPGIGIPEGASDFTRDAILALNRDFTREQNEDLSSESCYQPITDLANADDVKLTIKKTNKKHPQTIYEDGDDGILGSLGDMIFGRRGVLYFNNEEGLLTGSGNYSTGDNGEIKVTEISIESNNKATVQSPADGLSHEIGHGFNDLIRNIFSDQFYTPSSDPNKYENKEEENVIKEVDNRFGKIREDHYTGITFKAEDVFDDTFTIEKMSNETLNLYHEAGISVNDKSEKINK